MSDFVKNAPNAPKGHIAAEAAGLRWLAQPLVEALDRHAGTDQTGDDA